jgi:multiple sugar transport system permease protein
VTTIAQEIPPPLTRRRRRWEGLLPYWLILPTVVYLGLFFVWPMIQGFGLALRDEEGAWTTSALDTMVHDEAFGDAMRFTFLLILVIVPIQFVLAFGMALLLNSRLRGGGIFLYIFLLPLAISDLAAGIAWSAIFTERGYLNTVLEDVGVLDQPFIFLDPTSTTQLVLVVAAAEIWRSTTFMMVILFAGLQGIPRDYVEAAEVFGAGFFQRVRHVIFPMLKPSIQVALLLRLIFAFEVFAVVIALAGSSATVLAAEAYEWQAINQNEHVAAAYSVVILGLSLAAAAVVLVVLRTPRERRLR